MFRPRAAWPVWESRTATLGLVRPFAAASIIDRDALQFGRSGAIDLVLLPAQIGADDELIRHTPRGRFADTDIVAAARQ
jgi:hypothetical protein